MIPIFLIMVGCIVGVLLALPVLIPALRMRLQQNPAARNRVRLLLGIAALVLIFAGLSWGVSWGFSSIATCSTRHIVTANGTTSQFRCETPDRIAGLSLELWLRILLPPNARQTCITGSEVCNLITEFNVFTVDSAAYDWTTYLATIGAALTGLLVNWGMISWLTKPQKTIDR